VALRVDVSSASSIPAAVAVELAGLNSLFPEKWRGDWQVSLIDSQNNEYWELKLTGKGRTPQRRFLPPEKQWSGAVCKSTLELRGMWER
jgi:hypothetical protein